MTKEEIQVMRNKILQGIELAYQRLLIEKLKDDSELVFSHNGKIVAIKASDLIKKNHEDEGVPKASLNAKFAKVSLGSQS